MRAHTLLAATPLALALLSLPALGAAPAPGAAAEFACVSGSERIEKGTSTWGYARAAGSDRRIETTTSSVGWAKKAGSDHRIETFAGSTIGWLKGDKIEKPNGSSWTSLATASAFAASCDAPVAAALWVLRQEGKI